MGMPRKGSRTLEVNGEQYLWRVRGDEYSKQWVSGLSPIHLTLTCQRDEEHPGRVMQVLLKSRNPPEEDPDIAEGHRATLNPSEVRQIIAHARSKGWDPSERGSAFQLLPRHKQPLPQQYDIVEPL